MKTLTLTVLLQVGSALACDGLVVEQGWIRPPMPGMGMTAGYARLSNHGRRPLAVEEVSSPDFVGTELHRTLVENGVSRMRPGLPLPLAPGAVQTLEPGEYHLMLFEPKRPLKVGDSVLVEFRCGTQSMQAPFTLRLEIP